ncbi:MAG: hypothetical protein QG599_1951 [Pseudomonadota bacterium]|nr:hypothetical protein [Pseudomonadota bacterium]
MLPVVKTFGLLLKGLLLLVLLSGQLGRAEDPPTLTWHRMQFPPAFILAGVAQGQGFGDELLRMLANRLPQYHHRWVAAPLERVLERAGSAEHGLTCAGAMLQTAEREVWLRFSNPFLTTPPNGMIVRVNDLGRFESFIQQGRLTLGPLLQTGKFVIGITRQRSYGAPLNRLLAAHAGRPYLFEKSGQGAGNALLSDLAAQRGVDGVIAYHLEAAYWREVSHSPVALRFLPIAEAVEHEQWRIACSRTPQGEQAIAAINQVLADLEFRQAYLRTYDGWRERLADQLPGAPERLSDVAP